MVQSCIEPFMNQELPELQYGVLKLLHIFAIFLLLILHLSAPFFFVTGISMIDYKQLYKEKLLGRLLKNDIPNIYCPSLYNYVFDLLYEINIEVTNDVNNFLHPYNTSHSIFKVMLEIEKNFSYKLSYLMLRDTPND